MHDARIDSLDSLKKYLEKKMPWNITNGQLDPMTLTLTDNTVVNVAGGAVVAITSAIASISYHNLQPYALVGIWPFPANQAMTATYGGGQNIDLRNLGTGVTAIYQYA
jgi:hypothetical protein